jgi:hypothetical protein
MLDRAPAFASFAVSGALVLCGCPTGPAPTRPVQDLRLRLNNTTEATVTKVGDRRGMTVSFGPQGEQLIGAMLTDDSGPSLTRWHADPADAVQFDEGGAAATFKRAGKVKIWASAAGPDGAEVKSNELELQVTEP